MNINMYLYVGQNTVAMDALVSVLLGGTEDLERASEQIALALGQVDGQV
jgi:hypothetical protein